MRGIRGGIHPSTRWIGSAWMLSSSGREGCADTECICIVYQISANDKKRIHMSQTWKGVALAAALCCSSAQAGLVVNMGADPVDESVTYKFDFGPGAFTDVVLFSLTGTRGLVSTAFSNWLSPDAGLRNLTLELYRGNTLVAAEGPSSVVFVPGLGIPPFTLESLTQTLQAGNYRLELSGNVRPNGGFYVWTVSTAAAVAPVPEPEHWALMLAGLAAVGMAVARRSAVGV